MKTQALGPYIAALEERAALVDDLLVYIGDLEAVGAQVEADLLLTDRVYRDLRSCYDVQVKAGNGYAEALHAERHAHARTVRQAQMLRRDLDAMTLATEGRKAGLVHDSEERRQAAMDALVLRQEVEGLRKRVATLEAENETLRWKAAGRRIEVHMPAHGSFAGAST